VVCPLRPSVFIDELIVLLLSDWLTTALRHTSDAPIHESAVYCNVSVAARERPDYIAVIN